MVKLQGHQNLYQLALSNRKEHEKLTHGTTKLAVSLEMEVDN